MEIPIKPKHGYCINCDNRHGCKSQTPPCIAGMMENDIKGITGKQYLMERNEAHRCRDCPFFRSCWKMEEYRRLMG